MRIDEVGRFYNNTDAWPMEPGILFLVTGEDAGHLREILDRLAVPWEPRPVNSPPDMTFRRFYGGPRRREG